MGVAEVRWPGSGKYRKENMLIIFLGEEKQKGVAVILDEEVANFARDSGLWLQEY